MSEESESRGPKTRRFEQPTLVSRQDAVHFLWGDVDSGFVPDLVYGRGERTAGVVYMLGPGESFRSSDTWKPLYDQHRYYYVAQGTLAIQDPETGDIAVAGADEAVYWRGSRYHYGYNVGAEEVVVLDWAAPPERAPDVPEIETSVGKRPPHQNQPGRVDLLGRWPMKTLEDLEDRYAQGRMVTVNRSTALHFIHGTEEPVLMTLYVSTEALTGGTFELRPSVMSDVEQHPGDEVLYGLEGRLNVYLPESFEWFELNSLDCLYLPEGTPHRYCNRGAVPAKGAFCVTPRYR